MVSKIRIETASFTIPSPKRIALSYGNSFSFSIDKAATVSVAQRTAANTIHSTFVSLISDEILPKSASLIQIIITEKIAIDIKVPSKPSISIEGKLLIKFCLLSVYPAAKIMGGRIK